MARQSHSSAIGESSGNSHHRRRRRSRRGHSYGAFDDFMEATKTLRTVATNLLLTGALSYAIYWVCVTLLMDNTTPRSDVAVRATTSTVATDNAGSPRSYAAPSDQSTGALTSRQISTTASTDIATLSGKPPELFIVDAFQASLFASTSDSSTGKPLAHGMILRLLEQHRSWMKVSVVSDGQIGFIHSSMVEPLKP